MIKKEIQFKWNFFEKESFEKIKVFIEVAPSLQSPNFTKELLLYTFALHNSFVGVLTHKYQQGNECPIAFMSTRLQGYEPNHPPVEKQSFVVHKYNK
jgi:hypothetical protein